MANEYILKQMSGAAIVTALSAAINASVTSFDVATGSSLPLGSPGPFVISVGRNTASEEKMLVTSRTGDTLTIAERGYDGTTAQTHAANDSVTHVCDANSLQQFSTMANVMTAEGDLVTRGATAGSYGRIARGAAGIPLIGAGSGAPVYGQVVTAGVADAAVTIGKMAAAARPVIICTSGTRPTGTDRPNGQRIYETDTLRELTYDGTGWVIMSEPVQSSAPTWTNVTLGNGTSACEYHRSDGYLDFNAKLSFGTTTVVGGTVFLVPPVTMAGFVDLEGSMASLLDASAVTRYTGRTYVQTTSSIAICHMFVAGTAIRADNVSAAAPFTWATGDSITIAARYRMTTRYS